MSAIDALLRALDARPSAPALRHGERTWTYGELDEASRRLASGLAALGLGRGDRLACLLPPGPEVVLSLLAAWRLGAVIVPLNERYGQAELDHALADCGAALALVGQGSPARAALARTATPRVVVGEPDPEERPFAALLDAPPRPGRPRVPDDHPAWIMYTSGTTGRAKGVVHGFGALVAGFDALTRLWRWTDADRLALTLPLFHVHGLGIGVLGTLLRGAMARVLPFSPEGVVAAVAEGATVFMGVPTMYRRLLDHLEAHPADAAVLARARLFTAGSAALPAADFLRFEALTGHRILERYGMSETLLTLSNPYAPEARVPGSVGFPIPGVEARLVDGEGRPAPPGETGELLVRGPCLMQGYWGQPEASARALADGWFHTGDLAAQDAEGRFFHRGRLGTDLIKTGGYRLSAREVEEALADHPDIAELAVLGLPDPTWGERVTAFLVPRTGSPPRDPEAWVQALAEALAGRLADHKRPRAVILVQALPRNALGKVQKQLLKARGAES